jgi:2-oxoglutarate dehydrogenase E2 component (dihydrolipoamide succinyltransferase)
MIRHGELSISQANTGMPQLGSSKETRTPMSSLRKTIAQRLMYSQQSTATLTTFNEVDMSQVMSVRNQLKESFQSKHGVKLGFMSFFSAAVLHALKAYPLVNCHIDGSDVVDPGSTNLGIAVSTERGLVVPVIRDAAGLSYAQLEKSIAQLAEKARDGKLSIPDMQGGSFTITNGGVFGSLLSTPILNPPQSGILGMHKTEHRPMAIEKEGKWTVEVRPMMYVAFSYDHRLIDGATSVGFLVKVKEYLEAVTTQQVMA